MRSVLVEHIADAQGGDLVLAQAGTEGHGEDDVVAEAVAAGHLEQRGLLELGERPRRARDGGVQEVMALGSEDQ